MGGLNNKDSLKYLSYWQVFEFQEYNIMYSFDVKIEEPY